MSLPAADDLFRPTGAAEQPSSGPTTGPSSGPTSGVVRAVPDVPDEPGKKAASGRVRHDEKVTVYVTSGELLDIEQARLTLRGVHGLAVDRGRLVREAVALVLADLDENGEDAMIVRRLLDDE